MFISLSAKLYKISKNKSKAYFFQFKTIYFFRKKYLSHCCVIRGVFKLSVLSVFLNVHSVLYCTVRSIIFEYIFKALITAPLFVLLEILFYFGYRKQFYKECMIQVYRQFTIKKHFFELFYLWYLQ